MSCVLRTLNLCDGQYLEEPDHRLTNCVCDSLRHCEDRGFDSLAAVARQELQRRIEDVLAPPLDFSVPST